MSVEGRLAKLERQLQVEAGQRRVYSHRQLVALARLCRERGSLPASWDGLVGEPELVIGKDELSPIEAIKATVAAAKERDRIDALKGNNLQPDPAAKETR